MPEGPAEARRLRPLRPCRLPERRMAAATATAPRTSAPSPTSSTISSASSWRRPGRPPRATCCAARTCATISRSGSRTPSTAARSSSRSTPPRACEPCGGSGAKAGTSARTCSMCGGRGQVRARQGFFVVEQTCPTCRGVGEVIADPCPSCRGEGRVEKRKSLDGQHPRRASTKAPASASPAKARPACAAARRATSTSSSTSPGTRSSSARAPPCSRAARSASPPPRSAARSRCPGLDKQTHEIRIPAGIQSGKQLRQRGAGMPVLNGRGHGDMVIEIEVETPTKLSAKQREMLEQFRDTETGEECPNSQGLLPEAQDGWR